MKKEFKIFDRVISPGSPTLIIAEIGINHLGDVKLCEEMILSAIESGADCIKLQTGNAEESFHPNNISYSTFKGNELSKDSIYNLAKLANKNDSYLFSSPGDFSSLNLLRSISTKAYKVSSGQFTNIPIIEEMIRDNIPIIFSTGMAKESEIENVINLCEKNKFSNYSMLYCVSLYPTSSEQLNLNYINYLSETYNIITGYSDHAIGELACLAAVSMGAKIIEKHFTIDNNLQGADNKLSMNPEDFKKMCEKIRIIEKMKYTSNNKPHPLELELRDDRYRKILAKRDIKIGEEFNIENINFMRITSKDEALFAADWHKVSGKISKKFIKKHTLITKDCY
jgi:sialic acid synthase SpsE